jgi:two-component system response regulator MprA
MARVLVVDDEESIRELLEIGLKFEGFDVALAADGEAALAEARRVRPDLVVLDVMLPKLDGFEVCRRLRLLGDTPILMLTARGEVDDRVAGLDLGADDYMPKPFKLKELLARVRALLRRRGPGSDRLLTYADLAITRDTREVHRAGRPIALTPREFEILELLLSRPRRVFSRESIIQTVWGYDFIGDTNVVEVHVSALREKLGDSDRRLIQTVRGVGYTIRITEP